MSDQENPQVKIFFDSNRFPWERQYTDGKKNWYDIDQLNYDESENIFYLVNLDGIKISLILDSDIISSKITELDLDEYNKPKSNSIDISSDRRDFFSLASEIDLSQLPAKKYIYTSKTYPWNTLFYCSELKKLYDPNKKKLHHNIEGNEFYVAYRAGQKVGSYNPREKNLCDMISNQKIDSIQFKGIKYAVTIFKRYVEVTKILVS